MTIFNQTNIIRDLHVPLPNILEISETNQFITRLTVSKLFSTKFRNQRINSLQPHFKTPHCSQTLQLYDKLSFTDQINYVRELHPYKTRDLITLYNHTLKQLIASYRPD